MPKTPMWNKYMLRFIGRILVVAVVVLLWLFYPACFTVLEGWNFFRQFSILHLLWLLWMVDMVLQLLPARKYLALGSQKFFKRYYESAKNPDPSVRRAFINSSDRGALKVLVIWGAWTLIAGALYYLDVFSASTMVLLSTVFYLCDLICVLFWCPFRAFFMKNRCCTTCRIFNWDHWMMFSIQMFIPGFFSLSLFAMALVGILVWEITFHRHPERFWDRTNRALRCTACTDRLCTITFDIKTPNFEKK